LHNLAQNLNALYRDLPTSLYELGFKYHHAEGLKSEDIEAHETSGTSSSF
jgi:hypothetical protein